MRNELLNIIYDTLFENAQYKQFNELETKDQFISNDNNTIEFVYGNKTYELTISEQ